VQASQGEPDGKLHYTYGTFNIFGQLSGWLSEQTAPSYVQMSDSPALGVGGGTLFFAYHDLNSNVFKSIGLSPGGTWFANSVTQDGGVKMSGSPALAPENSLGAFTGTDGAANVTSGW
jgi:hypothetical protein